MSRVEVARGVDEHSGASTRRGTRATSAEVVRSYRAGGRPNCDQERFGKNQLWLPGVCNIPLGGESQLRVSECSCSAESQRGPRGGRCPLAKASLGIFSNLIPIPQRAGPWKVEAPKAVRPSVGAGAHRSGGGAYRSGGGSRQATRETPGCSVPRPVDTPPKAEREVRVCVGARGRKAGSA